jgi:hypothetical protein
MTDLIVNKSLVSVCTPQCRTLRGSRPGWLNRSGNIFGVLVFFLLSCCLNAATYYVATTGSDSNPGTLSQPFVTLQRGVNAAGPGDTIIVRDGTYRGGCSSTGSYAVSINKAGASNAWITLKAENQWRATLDAENACHSFINLGGSAAYWVIQDFRVINGYSGGIWSNSGASYITLRGNEIAYIGRHYLDSIVGICGSYANASSHDLIFDGNVIHDIGRTGGPQTNHDHGLYLHSQNTTAVNNVFYEYMQGWDIQTAASFSGLIANNTFYGSHAGRDGQVMLWDSNGSVTIRNNIFYAPSTQAITQYAFSPSSCTVDHNMVYGVSSMGVPSGCSSSSNLLNTDPMFANATTAPYDFHLRSGSPAINSGTAVPAAATDLEDITRPQGGGYDIGAYEWVSQPTTAPPVISALDVSSITQNSATLTWTTDTPSDSQAHYGTTTTPCNPTLTTHHSVLLTSLAPSTTYSCTAISKDAAGRTTQSSAYTFTTPAAPVAFGFSASASPASLSVEKGTSANVTITATLLSGTSQYVYFTTPNLPAGVTSGFSTATCAVTCSTTLTLWVSATAASGAQSIQVIASDGSKTSSTTIGLTITDEPPASTWDLAAYWAFDEGQKSIAYDSSINKNNGTFPGSPSWFNSGGIKAIQLLGGGYAVVNEHPSLEMTSQLTVAFWINPQDLPSIDERVITKSYSWDVKLNGVYRYPQFSAGSSYAKLNYSLPVGSWHYVAFTFSSGVLKGYIDGAPVSFSALTSFAPTLPQASSGLVIGSDAAKTLSMKGILDEVRLFGRALSDAEIAQLYALQPHTIVRRTTNNSRAVSDGSVQ